MTGPKRRDKLLSVIKDNIQVDTKTGNPMKGKSMATFLSENVRKRSRFRPAGQPINNC